MKPNVNSAVKCIAVANNKICLAKFKIKSEFGNYQQEV